MNRLIAFTIGTEVHRALVQYSVERGVSLHGAAYLILEHGLFLSGNLIDKKGHISSNNIPSVYYKKIYYYWCLHCSRAIVLDKPKEDVEDIFECPFPDCDGGYLDIWDWQNIIPGQRGVIPEHGKVYGQYEE